MDLIGSQTWDYNYIANPIFPVRYDTVLDAQRNHRFWDCPLVDLSIIFNYKKNIYFSVWANIDVIL